MKLDLVFFKDNKISEISKPVEKFDSKLADTVKAMFDVIHKHNGIGLAAIQIGVPQRIIIAEVDENKLIAINPEIIWKSDETSEREEGNLSLPGVRVKISRPREIEIKYQNLAGKEKTLKASGLLAICIQHEMEQMDGITILNHEI